MTKPLNRKQRAAVADELHRLALDASKVGARRKIELDQPLLGVHPQHWAHGLLWYHGQIGVVRLVESGDELEAMDGTRHPLRPVWPAHTMRGLERQGLIEWREMATDFGMILPKWQQTFVEPKPQVPASRLWPAWLQAPQPPALFGVTP